MENRILIKEDNNLFKKIAVQLKHFIPFLNELKSSFESLEIGNLKNEDYKKIILLGHTYHIDLLKEIINKRLVSLKITDLETKEKALNQYEKQIERFKKSIDSLRAFYSDFNTKDTPKLPLQFISHQNQLFLISKQDKEMILNTYCRVYFDKEEEIKLFNKANVLKENINEYLEILDSAGFNVFNKFLSLGHILQVNDNDRIEVNPDGIKEFFRWKRVHEQSLLQKKKKAIESKVD
jgi:hypothetical protein